MTKLKSRLKRPLFIIGITLMFIAIIGMATSGVSQAGITPATAHTTVYSPVAYEPNPTLNTNVSWSNFYNTWTNPLTYNNGTANLTLNTGLSSFYKNPISVNPSDIKTSSLQGKIAGLSWQDNANWQVYEHNNTVATAKISNTTTSITETSTTTGTNTQYNYIIINIPYANLPSSNLNFDYLTMIIHTTSTVKINNAQYVSIIENNATASTHQNIVNINNGISSISTVNTTYNNGVEYFSVNLGGIKQISNPADMQVLVMQNLPAQADTINSTITGMAISSAPYTLGTALMNNTSYTPTGAIGNIHLNKLAPNFPYTEVADSGYTVATSQNLQNVSISQSSINKNGYVEQTTTQGYLQLPSTPDLTYSTANITMPIAVNGNQYQVINLNGQSYINSISTMKNGTYDFGTVNPESQSNMIIEVEYTSSQWNKVSSPPGFFSDPIGTIEYYWYLFLGGALGLIGLGAGLKGRSRGDRVIRR